jgi:sugar phosphate isomerase/epimerase
MPLFGIVTDVFAGKDPRDISERCRAHGFSQVQVALPSGSASTSDRTLIDIFTAAELSVVCLQKSMNLLTPAGQINQENLDRYYELIHLAGELGHCPVSVCGTAASSDMWAYEDLTQSSAIWDSYLEIATMLIKEGERQRVAIAFEPFVASPLSTVARMSQLQQAVDSEFLRFIIDPCNLFTVRNLSDPALVKKVVQTYVAVTAERAVLVHCKDMAPGPGQVPKLPGAGFGVLDYDHFFSCLKVADYHGPYLIEHLREEEISQVISYLQDKWTQGGMRNGGDVHA